MISPKNEQSAPEMTIEAAGNYAANLLEIEVYRTGNVDTALHQIEQRYGISPNQVMHLKKRRAKQCDVSLFARLRLAYLDACAAQVRKLQHIIEIEKAIDGNDQDQDLADRLNALAAEIAAKKKRVK
jgi:hypothetical protein